MFIVAAFQVLTHVWLVFFHLDSNRCALLRCKCARRYWSLPTMRWPKSWGESPLSASSPDCDSSKWDGGVGRGSGQSGHWQSTPNSTRLAAGDYKKLVFTAYQNGLEDLGPSAAFTFTGTINGSSILGVTDHKGGVRVRSGIRHRTLASAALGSSPKSMSPCILETSVHFLLMCPFSGIKIGPGQLL